MHTLTVSEMPSHTHTQTAGSGLVTYGGGGGIATFASGSAVPLYTAPLGNTGGGGAHNNMPPTLMTNYIIKH